MLSDHSFSGESLLHAPHLNLSYCASGWESLTGLMMELVRRSVIGKCLFHSTCWKLSSCSAGQEFLLNALHWNLTGHTSGSRDSLLVRVQDSRLKGCEFKSQQKRQDNFLFQS